MAEELVITIKGDDQATDDLKRVLGALKQNEQAVKDSGKASDKSAESQRNLAGGMSKMKVAAAAGAAAVAALAAAAGAAVAVVSKLATAAADHGDNAAKVAQQIGVNVEAMQEYAHAAQLSGASQRDVEAGFRRLARAANEAAQGKAEYKEAFDQLGVSVKDASGSLKGMPELTEEIAGKLADMESETQKVALAQEVFGRGGAKLLPMLNQGADGIAAMRQEARDLGIVMSEGATKDAEAYQDAMLRLKSVGKGVMLQLGSGLLPALTALFDALRTIIGPIDTNTNAIRSFAFDAVDILVAGFGALIETISTLSPFFVALYTGVKQQIRTWRILWNVTTGFAKILVAGVAKGIEGILQRFQDMVDGAHALAKALDMDVAGSLAKASRSIEGVQGQLSDFALAGIKSASEDIGDIGEQLKGLGADLMNMPGLDAAIKERLAELQGRVQEAQRGIAAARHATPQQGGDTMPTAPATPDAPKDDSKGDDDAKKKAEDERRRNEIAKARIEILKTENAFVKANLKRRLELRKLQHEELTDKEKELRALEIQHEYEKRMGEIRKANAEAEAKAREDARKATADKRKEEADDIRAIADAFSGTGSQMAADVGKVVDVFADIKEGSASSVDAIGAIGQAASSFAGQMGASAEAQAAILAIFETAMGFATLFTNPAESAGHFLAAANFGMVAATGAGQGKSSGGGGSSLGNGRFRQSADEAARESGKVLAETMGQGEGERGGDVIYVDFSGATMLESAPRVQQRLQAATDEARSRQVRRRAGRG